MNGTKKISSFQNEILKWFEVSHREFPWRSAALDSYQYIIAEVLLQRTKAETIKGYYPIFISRFPGWKELDVTTLEELAEYLKPIGLYNQKASRLKQLAHEMILQNGILPNDRFELEKLPFLGQYIVNAILLFVYNHPSPLLDINMARVLERYFGKRKLSDIRYDPYLQKLAYKVVKHERSKDLNWAILDFSALVCKSKPLCSNCPLNQSCRIFNHTKSGFFLLKLGK